MQFLSTRNALIGYVTGLSAILGLMLMVFSGITAVNVKRGDNGPSRISMIDRH